MDMIEEQVTRIKFVVIISEKDFEKSVQWRILLSVIEIYIFLTVFSPKFVITGNTQ